jgi:pimeloyl-ACP methyl ester carboxylesterase
MTPASKYQAVPTASIVICDANQGSWRSLSRWLPEHKIEWLYLLQATGTQARISSIVESIDQCDAPIHLVGRGIGGAIALEVACRRANRISSLTLVDPCALHLLRSMGPAGREVLREVSQAMSNEIAERFTGRMRLDIFRRLALPTLLIETGSAAPAVTMLMQRLHAIRRRGRYERLDEGDGSRPGEIGRAIIASAAAHIRQRSSSVPVALALAA